MLAATALESYSDTCHYGTFGMFVLHYKGIDVVCLVGLQYHCELRNRFALDTHHLGRVFLMILMVSVMECPRLFPRPRPGKAASKASTVSESCEGGLSGAWNIMFLKSVCAICSSGFRPILANDAMIVDIVLLWH